ncbi:hypothetical protein QSJ18_19990, partial [Gordonia sp. ABSL1-1]|nr:hypothetical protein [Gordonia sp. ABSL1-1]
VTAEEWERRAAVAEGAAEALATAGDEASRVLLMNAFGKCVEGQALYDALARVIGAWQQELSTQKGHAIELANVCRRAGGELGTADSEASQGLRA